MTQDKKASMLPTENSINFVGLKLVKNAVIFYENPVVYIKHYATIIFSYNTKNNVCEVKMNCSMTSNRQIKEAIRFFDINQKSVKDTSDGSKWQYSGERTN